MFGEARLGVNSVVDWRGARQDLACGRPTAFGHIFATARARTVNKVGGQSPLSVCQQGKCGYPTSTLGENFISAAISNDFRMVLLLQITAFKLGNKLLRLKAHLGTK